MRKLMIAAMVVLGTATALAGDSDALKAIKKATTYAEAEQLVKQNLAQLVGDKEKAMAYNKLVELAMVKVDKQQTIIAENQMAQQLGTGKVQAYDTLGLYQGVKQALESAMECDKYDMMPNEKGKVAPKFHKANQERIYPLRSNLIMLGQTYGDNEKQAAYDTFSLYVESGSAPLFAEIDRTKQPDTYMGEVARVAAVYAFQLKDLDNANKYVDIAMKDTATFKAALDLKLYLNSQNLKNREDSVKFAATLQGIYDQNPDNDNVFGQLAAVYQAIGKKTESSALIEARLAKNPQDYTALALKGQNAMNDNQADVAIEYYKKAIGVKADDALIFTYLAFCINSKVDAEKDEAQKKAYLTESMGYLETARKLDPQRERANWAYPLYQCYYLLYGESDARTQEIEPLTK